MYLTDDLLPWTALFLSGSTTQEDSFAFDWHRHPAIECTVITEGSGTVAIGQHLMPYREGEAFLLGSGLRIPGRVWAGAACGLVLQMPPNG